MKHFQLLFKEKKTLEEKLFILKWFKEKGYIYITRDKESEHNELRKVCVFNKKPKKYRNFGWGYKEQDIKHSEGILPSFPADLDLDYIGTSKIYELDEVIQYLEKEHEHADN